MRRKLLDHLKPEEALAAKILAKLRSLHGRCTKREMERAMNASKQPLWRQAWAYMQWRRCVRVTAGKNRQQFVELVQIPERLEPRVVVKKRRFRREPTPWFQERLPEFLRRDGYAGEDDDVEVEAVDTTDWSASADPLDG
jgi:hypothetical protein